ncbi:unnamed protein product [Oppiella nova]|uniref:Uncharacterized protein n=1 Tax=Oppiella nova TaxID=334625 RepID=A0A7R9LR24_9ACAR|nr:unnamed protein product [Oppiella nova]CAG2165525.1 unnamed protein product [Oppiella nova]
MNTPMAPLKDPVRGRGAEAVDNNVVMDVHNADVVADSSCNILIPDDTEAKNYAVDSHVMSLDKQSVDELYKSLFRVKRQDTTPTPEPETEGTESTEPSGATERNTTPRTTRTKKNNNSNGNKGGHTNNIAFNVKVENH